NKACCCWLGGFIQSSLNDNGIVNSPVCGVGSGFCSGRQQGLYCVWNVNRRLRGSQLLPIEPFYFPHGLLVALKLGAFWKYVTTIACLATRAHRNFAKRRILGPRPYGLGEPYFLRV